MLTAGNPQCIVSRMARRKKFTERVIATFPEGTLARIEALRGPYEDRTEFFREAVERELQRREKAHSAASRST
jgi:metal-responsive CopG/Arc/MetJ family transcriptional regulator